MLVNHGQMLVFVLARPYGEQILGIQSQAI